MTHPLIILMQLNAITLDLDEAQNQIDLGRFIAADNQLVQLMIDRRQTEVDTRRAQVELALLAHASLN